MSLRIIKTPFSLAIQNWIRRLKSFAYQWNAHFSYQHSKALQAVRKEGDGFQIGKSISSHANLSEQFMVRTNTQYKEHEIQKHAPLSIPSLHDLGVIDWTSSS
jgi:hypothetical protein